MNPPISRHLKVFLCHGREDKPAVIAIYDRLVKDGIEPWLDAKDLLPGQDWRREITRVVKASDIVLVCLSQTSVTKEGYVQSEIKLALDVAKEKPEGTIFLIPLRLESCSVPDELSQWHWVNYFDADGYENLKRSLQARATQIGVHLVTVNP